MIILQGFLSNHNEWKDLETLSDIGSFHSTEKHYFYTETDNAIREPSTREKMTKDFESITVDFKEKAKEILNETQSLDDYIEKLQEFKEDYMYPPSWESEFMVWWRLMLDWSNFYDILRIRFAVKV
jgi:predicted P-loop ATPase/GTPase